MPRIKEERGSYHTAEGLASMKAKREKMLTPERRQRFAEETKEALKIAKQAQQQIANDFAEKYIPIIEALQKQKLTIIEIASKLNDDGHLSPRGTIWTDQTVRQILKRMKKPLLDLDARLNIAEKVRKRKMPMILRKSILI